MLTKHALSDDLIKRFSYVTLTSVENEILDAVNINGCLRDYVSDDPCYLIVNDIDAEKLGQALSYLEVSFVKINPDGINVFLFDYVHQHDLYEINASNIRLMLGSYLDMGRMLSDIGEERLLLVDYAKSTPYLMSYMNHYKVKERVERIIKRNPEEL